MLQLQGSQFQVVTNFEVMRLVTLVFSWRRDRGR